MSKPSLSRSARDRAVRQIAADMEARARTLASVLFDTDGRRMVEIHPTMRASTFVKHFERAWLGAVKGSAR